MIGVLLLILAAVAAAEVVQIPSSLDRAPQPALVEVPQAASPVPLLVHLHSWSSRFDNSNNFDEIRAEAARRGWAFVSPDFRGANDHPEACGSEQSIQDVADAVEWMKKRTRIDPRRIYLAGSSGGGYMALVMAGRRPEIWAAVSAWVPITDLVDWHAFSKAKGSRYWQMMEGCFGNAPSHGHALQQYRRRSPVHFLKLARGLPVDIQVGIQDGHTGSVPVRHSLWAFNTMAEPPDRFSDSQIQAITADAKIPPSLSKPVTEERQKAVLLRRISGSARVTIFDGGHEADFGAAARWLEQHRQPPAAIRTALQDHQVLQRDSAGFAKLPLVEGRGGRLQYRYAGGAWLNQPPELRTGGPYSLEFRIAGPANETLAQIARSGVFAGDLYLLAGQSNMVGRAPLVDPAPADPRVRMLNTEDVWTEARDPVHEALPRPDALVGIGLAMPFAKEMVRRDNVPVGLIPTAVGGTSLEQWSPKHRETRFRRALYGNMLARAQLAGGKFRAVLWYQGEADASTVETARTYGERFQALVATIRADLGDPKLPFYYAQLSRYVIAKGYEGWDTVREAQRLSEDTIAPGGMVATIDLPLSDPIHLSRTALETLGRRFAARVAGASGPRLEGTSWDGPGRLRLKFSARLQAPGDRVLGFDSPDAAIFHAELDPRSADVILSLTPPAHPFSLHYGRGLNPVCNLVTAGGLALPAFGPVPVEPSPQ